jgi:NADPH-dependent 2,4-dienoyl-CoA reductase/sulfur reductase-like enzyme/rhodanese-related sulfurtransferase
MHKMVIVGGVAAGATAAARARRLSGDAEITVLEAGPDVSFANCGLPYYIGGDITSRSKLILQSPESFKDQYNVTVQTETEVVAIDKEAKTVTAKDTKSGRTMKMDYDSLILAQGGKPIVPPLPGVDQNHVFSLWTLADMDAIHKHIEQAAPRSAVVVGGGFIGLEMAEALKKRGLEVTVVERLPQVMPNLEAEIAGFLTQELASYGVDVLTGRSVSEIHASTVKLDDDREVSADMVLMSVGVKPTLKLAEETGLAIGEAGGLLVDEYLCTSDPSIFAAGDMVEIEHRVFGRKVRIPLAGPANRQGRLAAGNALGVKRPYSGSMGTSIVRVFEAVAGSTGLSLSKAREAGIPADAVTVHKEHHTSYYPGSKEVTVMLIYNRDTGVIIGGQTAGYAGADRRLDVLATAVAAKMTLGDIAELDLAYAPPLGTANDPVNMAAFTAENRLSGFSPSLTAGELDDWAGEKKPQIVDIRDTFARDRAHIEESLHIPLGYLESRLSELDASKPLLVVGENGKKGHQALRRLTQAGFTDVVNASGGYTSLERHERSVGFKNLSVGLSDLESKTLEQDAADVDKNVGENEPEVNDNPLAGTDPVVIDVRTPEEFDSGAYPGAVNLPLDELGNRIGDLGPFDRDIVVYCASGARSAYAQRILMQVGYSNVRNGGGIMDMMYSR